MSYYKDLGAEELSLWDRFKQGLFPSGVTPAQAAAAAAPPVPSACVEYAAKMGMDAAKTAAYLATGPTNDACLKKLAKLAAPAPTTSSFPLVPVVVGAGILALVLLRRKR